MRTLDHLAYASALALLVLAPHSSGQTRFATIYQFTAPTGG
jgi:hypothetical protein